MQSYFNAIKHLLVRMSQMQAVLSIDVVHIFKPLGENLQDVTLSV